MRPLYRVTKEHKASFPKALIAQKGDVVDRGREDPEMPGWYWCKDKNGMEAWIPETHLDGSVFNQPYNSIELTVKPGDVVQYLGESLGWAECLNKDWVYGWIPLEKMEKL